MSKEITKEIVYQDMLDTYKLCGQGNDTKLFEALGLDVVLDKIHELIVEGLVIKQTEGHYKGWVYLANAPYSPESESELGVSGLYNIRRFIGVEESFLGQHTDDKSYGKWLERTGITLDKINQMKNYDKISTKKKEKKSK